MHKLNLMLDLDGVIYNFTEYQQPRMHDFMFNKGIEIYASPEYYDLQKYYGSKEIKDLFFSTLYDEYIANGKPFQFADKYTDVLSGYYNIHIVTARGTLYDEERSLRHKNDTLSSLVRDKIKDDKIAFTDDKIQYINKNKIDVAVEDHPQTILNIIGRTKATPICYGHPYNTNMKGVTDVVYSQAQLAQTAIRIYKEKTA